MSPIQKALPGIKPAKARKTRDALLPNRAPTKSSMFTITEAQQITARLIGRSVPHQVEFAVGRVLIVTAAFNWTHVVEAMNELGIKP